LNTYVFYSLSYFLLFVPKSQQYFNFNYLPLYKLNHAQYYKLKLGKYLIIYLYLKAFYVILYLKKRLNKKITIQIKLV